MDSQHFQPLARADLPEETLDLARFLIGCTLVRVLADGARLACRIVETEAYPPGDAAGHAYTGQTARNRSLFRERGFSYVYLAYGLAWCANVSSGLAGVGSGVLLRAGEPLGGVADMARRRGAALGRPVRPLDITRGPGRLAQAMAIGREQDGLDLCAGGGELYLAGPRGAGEIGESVRIGITKEAHRAWRFYERGNPHVSGRRALSP